MTVTKIVPLTIGDRVCVDTCSLMRIGEGMLIGSQSSCLFLVNSESMDSEYVASRPFRVNAGAVHAYILTPSGKTKYLAEIKGGDEVLAIDNEGNCRSVVVGRSKIERRPLLLVEVEVQGKKYSTILQNAETIRLVTPEGPISISDLKPGQKVLVRLEEGGRHFGHAINETIMENLMRACVSINEHTLEEALGSCHRAIELGADMLEVRFDHLDRLPSDLAAFKDVSVPMIATLRPKGQGGLYEGTEEEKERFLRKAMRSGFQYLDLESGSSLLDKRDQLFRNAVVIGSYHDLEKTPSTASILELLVSNASIANLTKAAFMIRSIKDVFQLVQAGRLYSSTGDRFVLIGMGELGEISRSDHKKSDVSSPMRPLRRVRKRPRARSI